MKCPNTTPFAPGLRPREVVSFLWAPFRLQLWFQSTGFVFEGFRAKLPAPLSIPFPKCGIFINQTTAPAADHSKKNSRFAHSSQKSPPQRVLSNPRSLFPEGIRGPPPFLRRPPLRQRRGGADGWPIFQSEFRLLGVVSDTEGLPQNLAAEINYSLAPGPWKNL